MNLYDYYEDYKLHISTQDIDESLSHFIWKKEINADEIAQLHFAGTDSYKNSINYYDLFKIFNIKLTDSDGKDVEKKEANLADDKSKLIIDLKINVYVTFIVKVLKNKSEMKL